MLALRHIATGTTIAIYDPQTEKIEICNCDLLEIIKKNGIDISGIKAKLYGRTCVRLDEQDFGKIFKEIFAPRVYPEPAFKWVKIDKI